MPQTIADLGKKVKAKYPGQYDDLPDADVGKRVKAKYPGAYDDFTDAPPQPSTWSDKLGTINPIGRQVVDFAEGVTSGVASTAFHGGDLLRRMVGAKRVINNPDAQQAMKAPPGFSGGLGKFAEQAAEVAIPFSQVSKATSAMRLLPRMAAEAATAGGATAVQSGGDPVNTALGVTLGAAGPVVGKAAGAVRKAVGESEIPLRLYQSALKPSTTLSRKEGVEILETGMQEKIPVSAKGLEMVRGKIDELRSQISEGIKARGAQGITVDSSKVVKTLDDLEAFYKETPAPQSHLDDLASLKEEFAAAHGQQIPIDKAQKLKQNAYVLLRKSYGEMKSARVEGIKGIARGLKEQISEAYPEIAGLNERQSRLLDLEGVLERAVQRIDNHQMMGIGSGIAAGAGGALMGKPGALVSFAGKLVLDDPVVKSRIAIALRLAKNSGSKAIPAAAKATVLKAATP
jgi:hypothetical protein